MSSIPLPKSYLEKILGSINRLTESCVLNVSGENLYSICCSPDTTIILYARAKLPVAVNPAVQLNLISIKKLLSGLECLGNDGVFSMEHDINSIRCQIVDDKTEEKTFFKYHLVDNSVIKEAPVSINKISSLKFDTEFIIPVTKIKQIMAGYAFVSDSTKIYFSTDEQKVLAEINDKTQPNVDNINLIVSKEFSGNPIDSPMALNMEVFKILTSCRSDIKVKINSQYKVFVFQSMEEENIELKYIISALVK